MADGSCIAFFEAGDMEFDFKNQLDFDLHIALEVDRETLMNMKKKGEDLGMEVRGVSDHHFIEVSAILFRQCMHMRRKGKKNGSLNQLFINYYLLEHLLSGPERVCD